VIPVLHSERLTFRAWRESDLAPMAAFYADATMSRFVRGPMGKDDVWRRIALEIGHWALRGYGRWALEEKSTGEFVGWAGLWYPHGFPAREIGWGLVKAKQGNGYASEAAERARAYAYETLGWDTVASVIALDNTPSIKVAQRLGATREGDAEFAGMACAIYRHPSRANLASPSNAIP